MGEGDNAVKEVKKQESIFKQHSCRDVSGKKAETGRGDCLFCETRGHEEAQEKMTYATVDEVKKALDKILKKYAIAIHNLSKR